MRRPWRGFPTRPPYRLPRSFGHKPKVMWAPAAWDGPTGRPCLANTAYFTPIVLEEATPTAFLTQAATQDWVLKRLFGELRHAVYAASNNNCSATIHAGLAIEDISSAGAYESTASPLMFPIFDGTNTRRWLWQRHKSLGLVGPGYIPTNGATLWTSDFWLPNGSWLDITPNCRVRPDQRIILCEYLEANGSADCSMQSWAHLKPLVMLTSERRR